MVSNEKSDALSQKISVFPNPFNDKINITSVSGEPSTVSLLTITGQLLLQRNFSGSTQLNIPDFPDGIYLVEIISASHKEIFKLKKQKD